jgi:biotin operon repressor
LYKDEVALSRKMLGRTITEFYCLDCLAAYLECSVADLKIKIQEFREQGCALFL